MVEGIWILLMVGTVLVVAPLASRLGVAAPLALVVVGIGASFLPFVPHEPIDPEIILTGLLPPLLYASAIGVSLLDVRSEARPILLLSVGLVAFTALGVGATVWWLLPVVGFAAAFALGAVVAPPDAVSATAIGRTIGLPRRVLTMLEGESLLNDATALVLLSTAIAAMSGAATVGSITGGFLLSAVGGAGVGFVVAWVVGQVHQRVTSPSVNTGLSLITPWLAFMPAEAIHASGVLAVVVAGLIIAHKSPMQQNALSRISQTTNWRTVQFLLENLVFLIIGLQLSTIIGAVADTEIGVIEVVLVCLAVFVAVVVLRFVWVFVTRFAVVLGRGAEGRPLSVPEASVLAFAGMRGVVTLAAAFALPPETPQREVLVLVAMVVAVGSLLIEGSLLPWFARLMGVRGPGSSEDALQEAHAVQRVMEAGVKRLDEIDEAHALDPDTVDELRRMAERRINRSWEALGSQTTHKTPAQTFRALRIKMLRAEREEALRIRADRGVDHEVLQRVMISLDMEEAVVLAAGEGVDADADDDVVTPDSIAGECEHLEAARDGDQPEADADHCLDCDREGTATVHLRMCLTCGKVGCCDSSPATHARRHHDETGHPVMRSIEPNEAWLWCYPDELLG
ncbi:Na+/H+ antiporter [Tersicoccus solisilvae]|uniref:Na+/H+ antiporter n=1 Tax=Tersicoccus solisilvae TaxID=1882339 RepID=A0ABQ1NJL3_9MICC|nr:Na+/H+ antiporter [Tersicoccus solisilvae]GGC78796.1 Na+/H+ antiporter [Tersicoccus solisilvae]